MNKVLSRHLIHPEIQWYQIDNSNKLVLGRQEINEAIDFWKIILGESNFSTGKLLGPMLSLCDVNYLSLLFATLELGGALCVMDKPRTLDQIDSIRARVFAPIDIIVTGEDKDKYKIELAVAQTFSKKQLCSNLWFDYVAKEFSYKDIFVNDPMLPALLGTSSGTTGVPKKIVYSHKFLLGTAERCIKKLKLEKEDRVLHLSNLHHGGSAGIFFFPSLMACRHHYFEYMTDAMEKIIDTVLKEKITKIMFPNSLLLEEFLFNVPKVEHKLDLYTLQSKVKSWLPHVKRANINSIYSVFGSTEVLGPVFENIFTINDDPGKFNILNYGKPLNDDFFQIEHNNDGRLSVTVQNNFTHVLNDQFNTDDNGNYIFSGRADIVRVNEVSLTMQKLDNITKKYFESTRAFLIPDATTNKLYLLCSPELDNADFDQKRKLINQDLLQIDPILKVDFVSFDPISYFVYQIKFSYDIAKQHFQKKFNLT